MKTILVGTDFTPAGNQAVRYAAEMAFQHHARLIVWHATQLTLISESPLDLRYVLDEIETHDLRKMTTIEKQLQRKYANRLNFKTSVETGFIRDILTKKSHQFKPDLVVMGMPQVDFLSKKLFGSTSVRVLDMTRTPVLIVPEKATFKPLKKLVLTADGLPIKSKTNIQFIAQFLENKSCSMHYLHVKDELYPGPMTRYWNKLHAQFSTDENSVHELSAIPGKKALQLLDWSYAFKADWIITVARERNFFWNVFHESISKRIAHTSQKPVLIFHDK